MEGHELLGKVNKVVAPPGFEARVMAGIAEERRAQARRQAVYRYAFAGTAAVLVIGFLLVNPLDVRRAGIPYAGKGRVPATSAQGAAQAPLSLASASRTGYLPVLETVDYSAEMRDVSRQPRTVYILEQVSEERPTEIKY